MNAFLKFYALAADDDYVPQRYRGNETIKAVPRELEMGTTNNFKF